MTTSYTYSVTVSVATHASNGYQFPLALPHTCEIFRSQLLSDECALGVCSLLAVSEVRKYSLH